MPVVKSAPNRFLAASVSSKAPVRTRRNGSHPAFTSGTIKRFPCRPLFRPSWILAKGLCEQSIDDTRKADHLTVGDGRWTSSTALNSLWSSDRTTASRALATPRSRVRRENLTKVPIFVLTKAGSSSPEGGSEIGKVRPLTLGNTLSGTRIKN